MLALCHIDLNQDKLQAYGLSSQDVVDAIARQNVITPVGTEKVGAFEYVVTLNDAPSRISELNDLPIRTVNGVPVYVHDVAYVHEGSPPQINMVRVNGANAVLMTILKTGSASTLDVLAGVDGHVTGAELVERSRRIDPETTPSTVYRTLDVLEELGVVAHSHGREGRQEFHVNPVADHGHLVCSSCGRSWELGADEVGPLVDRLRTDRGFDVSVDHLTVEGRCATCRQAAG